MRDKSDPVCMWCGKKLKESGYHKCFCSSKCKKEYDTTTVRKCRVCGKVLYIGDGIKYCRDHASSTIRKKHSKGYLNRYSKEAEKIRICLYCKKEFKTARTRQLFCSHSCSRKFKEVPKEDKLCGHCGKVFSGASNKKFCSDVCRVLASIRRSLEDYHAHKSSRHFFVQLYTDGKKWSLIECPIFKTATEKQDWLRWIWKYRNGEVARILEIKEMPTCDKSI